MCKAQSRQIKNQVIWIGSMVKWMKSWCLSSSMSSKRSTSTSSASTTGEQHAFTPSTSYTVVSTIKSTRSISAYMRRISSNGLLSYTTLLKEETRCSKERTISIPSWVGGRLFTFLQIWALSTSRAKRDNSKSYLTLLRRRNNPFSSSGQMSSRLISYASMSTPMRTYTWYLDCCGLILRQGEALQTWSLE